MGVGQDEWAGRRDVMDGEGNEGFGDHGSSDDADGASDDDEELGVEDHAVEASSEVQEQPP